MKVEKVLLRRRDWLDRVGVSRGYADKLVRLGVIPVIRPGGRGKALYRKEDIERVFQVKL